MCHDVITNGVGFSDDTGEYKYSRRRTVVRRTVRGRYLFIYANFTTTAKKIRVTDQARRFPGPYRDDRCPSTIPRPWTDIILLLLLFSQWPDPMNVENSKCSKRTRTAAGELQQLCSTSRRVL